MVPVFPNMYNGSRQVAGEHDYDTIPDVLEQMQLQQIEMVGTHARMHAITHSLTHALTHTHTHTHTHSLTHTHTREETHPHTYRCTHTHTLNHNYTFPFTIKATGFDKHTFAAKRIVYANIKMKVG